MEPLKTKSAGQGFIAHACWYILDKRLYDGVLALLPNYSERILAMRFLDGEEL